MLCPFICTKIDLCSFTSRILLLKGRTANVKFLGLAWNCDCKRGVLKISKMSPGISLTTSSAMPAHDFTMSELIFQTCMGSLSQWARMNGTTGTNAVSTKEMYYDITKLFTASYIKYRKIKQQFHLLFGTGIHLIILYNFPQNSKREVQLMRQNLSKTLYMKKLYLERSSYQLFI